MILSVTGNINRYYIQTLCMLFFPGAKFSPSEQITEETPIVDIVSQTSETGVTTTAVITVGDKTERHTHTENYSDTLSKDSTAKISAGIAMYVAGSRFFGVTPSWGILTGVRPAKFAAEMKRSGMKKDEIRKTLISQYYLNPKKSSLITDIAFNESRIIHSLEKRSCSIYISIPFCPSRCAYCSFVSYSTQRLLSMIPEYLDRLVVDVANILELAKSHSLRISTIYIGGGTPTILNEEQLDRLLGVIEEHIDVSALREYTLESGRPDTITAEKMRIARAHGVTRVCINPQTLNDDILREIGRRHTSEDFFRAYDIAKAAEIPVINTDLIAGLPGEKFESFSKSIDRVLRLKPENITFHTFCVKKSADVLRSDTDIYSRTGGDTGKSVDYSQIQAKAAGYIPYYIYRQKNTVGNYENVGFAVKGTEGLFNIFTMEEVHSILAVGAGAVTKLVAPDKKHIERLSMPKYPYEYLAMDKDSGPMEEYYKKVNDFFTEYYKK